MMYASSALTRFCCLEWFIWSDWVLNVCLENWETDTLNTDAAYTVSLLKDNEPYIVGNILQ